MNNTHRKHTGECGFTLVELMIAIVVAMLITAAVYAAYVVQQRSYKGQEQVAETQQNIRAALLMMTRDLRMAGYYPVTGAAGRGILVANANQLQVSMDLTDNAGRTIVNCDTTPPVNDPLSCPSDGDSFDTNENIEFALNGTNLQKCRRPGGPPVPVAPVPFNCPNPETIAEDIEAIEFFYTVDDGTGAPFQTVAPTAADLRNVVSVEITILARASQQDHNYTNNRTYLSPANQNFGSPFNDNLRRRMLTTTLQLRNM